jgi:CheY-like chemotaxis protein/nitrogen-specific signal transduction histidine kinase
MTSHEMRNPLSAIVQCADVVVGSLVGLKTSPEISPAIEASIDAAQTIVSCAQHQKRIVDDILTLSKLDSDLLTITLIQLDPKKILRDSLKMFEAEASRADIKLSPIIDSSVDELKVEYVLLDPSRLLQVLINLLTNALKFTTNGEIKVVTVTMKAFRERPSTIETHIAYVPARGTRPEVVKSQKPTPDDLYLHFSVCDTGRGLTEGEKKMLFKRFSQVSPRTHVQYGGSGLGLFISRELTELQGGEIGVASEAGVGSTFAFYVKAQRTTAPKESSPFSSSYNAAQFSPSDIVSQLSVLVVEDNLINQAVLSKQLRRLGCTVHLANHGQEALAFLEETNFWRGQEEKGKDLSVVLLDIEMPVMDGLTCVKRVRDLQSRGLIRGHIPIIAVSANARSEQIMTAMEAGMDDVVVKPFRIPDLMPKIMELVQRLRSNGHHVRPSVR